MSDLFSSEGPRLYSIPPGANFLDELASALVAATGLESDPEALADALIYVPNHRSERALAFALYQASGREACLLPDIRALGDLETEEPPPSAEVAFADLPPALPNAQRIGELTRLVMAYYQTQNLAIPPTSALAAARELARLLDQAALSGEVDWARLEEIVPDKQLARHWQQSLEFLKIITQQWPVRLEDAAAMDPYARRFAAAEALAEEWARHPPQTPVVIAGSTGATPASRVLMRAAMALPMGLVVLPGLDREAPETAWAHISETPSHPQFTLARTLDHLQVRPSNVAVWPQVAQIGNALARRRLIHEALAPADNTADWTDRLIQMAPDGDAAGFVKDALSGLSLLETSDETDEAMAAALLLRETLETEGETAALVTPDAGLARRVSALLKQWQVEVPASAGMSLLQSRAGSLAFLVMDWLTDLSHPVKLLAVLRHASGRFSAAQIDTLDRHFLRGIRAWDTLAGLRQHIEAGVDPERQKYTSYTDRDIAAALDLLDQLEAAMAKAGGDDCNGEPIAGPDWYGRATALIDAVSQAPAPWAGSDGASLSRLYRDLAEMSAPLGLQAPIVFNDLFKTEAAEARIASGYPHPRLAIWGPLEARLQTADRLILAGLNEGVWPAQPAADAFLPRVFRREIGLSDPDERIGLSAHDFAQLAAAPNVTLLAARRRADKPAVASRWIWRLRTLARGALGAGAADSALAPPAGANPLAWVQAMEQIKPLPAGFRAEPRPCPPIAARPRKLSVTRIETLVRDPYAIYCQYVLGLQSLDPLNLPGDARARGTAVHKALEVFETGPPDQGVEDLLSLLEAELRRGGESEADLIALRESRRQVAAEYLAWRGDNAHRVSGEILTEETGKIEMDIGGATFRLTGTADRIERRGGQAIAILDFKTGKPPSERQVRSGLSPQMSLQGLIAQRGGYGKLAGSVSVEALTYIRFGAQFKVDEIGQKAGTGKNELDPKPIAEIIDEAEQGLIRLLTAFADPAKVYLSAPQPERVTFWSDYTRLARRPEWAGLDAYD